MEGYAKGMRWLLPDFWREKRLEAAGDSAKGERMGLSDKTGCAEGPGAC